MSDRTLGEILIVHLWLCVVFVSHSALSDTQSPLGKTSGARFIADRSLIDRPKDGSPEGVSIELPDDQPVVAEILHKRKFVFDGSQGVFLDLGYLYGDKFLDTKGVQLSWRNYFSSVWGVDARFGYFLSETSDDAKKLSLETPLKYDPRFTVGGSVLWQPVYGKFLLGESIYHFIWGFRGGLTYFGMKQVDGDVSEGGIGPIVGTYFMIPFENSILFQLFVDYAVQPKMKSLDSTGGFRRTTLLGIGLGYHF